MAYNHTIDKLIIFIYDNDIGESLVFCMFNDLLQWMAISFVKHCAREDGLQIQQLNEVNHWQGSEQLKLVDALTIKSLQNLYIIPVALYEVVRRTWGGRMF